MMKHLFKVGGLAGIVLPLGLTPSQILAGSNSTTLPNGSGLEVFVDAPVTGTEFFIPLGVPTIDVNVIGSASVGLGEPDATFIYDVDVSGSTGGGSGTGCSPVLQCEKIFLKALNEAAILDGSVDEVGLVSYASNATVHDLDPVTSGSQIIIPPDAPQVTPYYVDLKVDSLSSGGGTNCHAGLEKALTVVQASNNSTNMVIFTSDGVCNGGNLSGFDAAIANLAAAGAVVNSVAIGSNSSCGSSSGVTLQRMANLTGGTCFEVTNPGNLPDIIPALISSSLDSLEIEVNGGGKTFITNSDINPDLPHPGAISVDYGTTVFNLGPGDYQICVTANGSDPKGTGSTTQCEDIKIIALLPPVAQDDAYNATEDVPLIVSAPGVLGNDTDPNSDPLTVEETLNTPPSHGTVIQNSDGSFAYTPNLNYCGTDGYAYTVSDGNGGTDTANVVINVACVNDPPVAKDNTYAINEDTPLIINSPGVLGNDSDVDGGPLKVVSNTSPSHGTVIQNSDGSFTYMPNLNFCGTDGYAYTVSDGNGGTDTANVVINVACINDPPVAKNDTYATNEDTQLTVNAPGVLDNDSDVDGGPLKVVFNTLPSHGTVIQNKNGSLTYKPKLNFCGTDGYAYKVSDGNGGTDTAKVVINVACVNDPPVAMCQDLLLEADAITCRKGGDVNAGSYDIDDGDEITLDYSNPGTYFAGTTVVTLIVTDESGETDSCEATVTVCDITPPVITIADMATTIWPPNHKYKSFGLADCGVQVVDSCDGEIDVSSLGIITSGYSDEPENAKGNGDGNTVDDIVITGSSSFKVRAERAGKENGRVYGITFDVNDGSGNTSEAVCHIGVPHSQNGDAPIDDGPVTLYP